ncbi:MAG: exodeoxyribonuclease VII small subunit [Lachnospiraceae bacterium]|nr:exodeoxyribonuclease VII small subunit [Lachnospiraceae bacterium]
MSDFENITIEDGFDKLNTIINQMEDGEVSLEESFKLYNEGIKLIKACNDKIDYVEKQIKLIGKDGEEDDI